MWVGLLHWKHGTMTPTDVWHTVHFVLGANLLLEDDVCGFLLLGLVFFFSFVVLIFFLVCFNGVFWFSVSSESQTTSSS